METACAAHFMAAFFAYEMAGHWTNPLILTSPSTLYELRMIEFWSLDRACLTPVDRMAVGVDGL